MSEPVLLTALALIAVAAVIDLRTREIPDTLSILLVVIGVLAATFSWAGIQWWMFTTGLMLGFLIGYGLFRFAGFGGGDAKLIAGIGAILGPVGLLLVLFVMALAGGVLALIAMSRGQRDYAYGPAILVGYVAYLIFTSRL